MQKYYHVVIINVVPA